MLFLETLMMKKYENEREWLRSLRVAAGEWFNTLTEPLLPVLTRKVGTQDPDAEKIYGKIGSELLEEAFVVNAGDELQNIFAEMGRRGIPFSTSRKPLEPLLEKYLETGLFLKKLVYGFDPEQATLEWREFRCCKNDLIKEINRQIRNLG